LASLGVVAHCHCCSVFIFQEMRTVPPTRTRHRIRPSHHCCDPIHRSTKPWTQGTLWPTMDTRPQRDARGTSTPTSISATPSPAAPPCPDRSPLHARKPGSTSQTDSKALRRFSSSLRIPKNRTAVFLAPASQIANAVQKTAFARLVVYRKAQ